MVETKLLLDIKVPDNTEILNEIEETIEKHKKDIKKGLEEKTLNLDNCKHYTQIMLNCLYALGEKSKPLFDIQDEIRDKYYTTYVKTPNLAKELYIKHLDKIHNRYNILKNRCFRLLDEIEKYAIKKFKI